MSSTSNPGVLEERCRRLESQISTMKTVSSLRKNLLDLRERQAKDLITKLKFYEVLVTEERLARHSLSSRVESAESQCEQLTKKLKQNISSIEELKENYENKVSTLINELQTSEQRNQQLSDQVNCAQLRISEVTNDLTMEELGRKLDEATKMLDDKNRLTKELQKQMKKVLERNKVLSYQMSLLNNLFSETEGVTIDFEKIKTIGDIVRESQTYTEEAEEVLSDEEFSDRRTSVDLENILDSIEKSENVPPADIPGEESCYKTVDSKRGPQLVLSVSRTFIKLKDLIVEKKSLQKEIDTLKTLNTKLESKVDKQEHRLYRVTMELNKTWSLVSKLKQQHKRLYNSEAVLRYELQEKRALLEKLKNELSASREKWRRVRQKNSQSQVEWEKLRDEFAQRKHQSSQESGTFSEVMSVSSSGENDVAEEDGIEMGNGKKLEKSKTLPMSFTTTVSADDSSSTAAVTQPPASKEVEESVQEEEEFEEGAAGAVGPLEEEHYDDPLEELVSQLVEDIDNEADTEEESSSDRTQLENDSSPSPDFEDRMKRRANRLRMLEEQCILLNEKLSKSFAKSVALSSKLAELHDHYGPSGSLGTPRDEQQQQKQQQCDSAPLSQSQDEVSTASATQTESSSSVTDAQAASTSTTNADSDSTLEDNSVTEKCSGANLEAAGKQKESDAVAIPSVDATCLNDTERNEPGSTTKDDEIISKSENSSTAVASSCPVVVKEQNNGNPTEPSDNKSVEKGALQSMQSQGHDEVSSSALAEQIISKTIAEESQSLPEVEGDTINLCNEPAIVGANATFTSNDDTGLVSVAVNIAESSSRDLATSAMENKATNANLDNCVMEEQSQPLHQVADVNRADEAEELQASLVSVEANASVEIQEVSESQVSEEILPAEEPLPIIQETVVQHFPTTTEEETGEFAPVQIRPEFLRILQEADEATNMNTLDWMPSLLTITHSVALLRLDHDSPSVTNRNSNNRSLSESLRIEIPRQSPSPPPATHHRQEENDGSSGTNHNDGNNASSNETDRTSVLRKDPSFLSRMIIKQLPKRLQLLKNENHTLEMEAAEAKMRMKEMKRQLTKELDRQQQLTNNLDAQIEDKNLIEFELREELEKKEKVIDELQLEIDESKKYIDELRTEKDDIEAFLKIFVDERIDLSQPKTPPESVKSCNNCKRPFSLVTRRKVHCKICGKVFCKDCALQREPNKRSSKRPRLCTRCHLRRLRLVVLVNASKQSTPAQAK